MINHHSLSFIVAPNPTRRRIVLERVAAISAALGLPENVVGALPIVAAANLAIGASSPTRTRRFLRWSIASSVYQACARAGAAGHDSCASGGSLAYACGCGCGLRAAAAAATTTPARSGTTRAHGRRPRALQAAVVKGCETILTEREREPIVPIQYSSVKHE